MKLKLLYLLFFIVVGYKTTAQITYIPDQGFEQALISLDIDSDGIVNGQIFTSDVENVIELNLDSSSWSFPQIYDLTGIQDFILLEKLNINFTEITGLDVSQNLQLKELDCSSNWLTSLDISSNTLLEILHIGNTGGDVGPFNMIEEIDLSNNPNIHTLYAYDLWDFKKINLKNGNNNPNVVLNISFYPPYGSWDDPNYDPNEIYQTICIEVDDVELAQNNQLPYSDWDISHYQMAYVFTDDVEACALNTPSFVQKKISVYPNPVADMLYFDTTNITIEKVVLFDFSGRKILEQNEINNSISVSDLQKGNYILKIFSDKGVQTEKIIVK